MREIRTSGSPSGDWKRSRSKSGHAGLPPRQSSTLPEGVEKGCFLWHKRCAINGLGQAKRKQPWTHSVATNSSSFTPLEGAW